MADYGAYSEVGKLKKVIVHRPGLAISRLTPSNCQELLFDDVLWVKQARQEHMAFCDLMRHRGIEVYLVRELLEKPWRTWRHANGCSISEFRKRWSVWAWRRSCAPG